LGSLGQKRMVSDELSEKIDRVELLANAVEEVLEMRRESHRRPNQEHAEYGVAFDHGAPCQVGVVVGSGWRQAERLMLERMPDLVRELQLHPVRIVLQPRDHAAPIRIVERRDLFGLQRAEER